MLLNADFAALDALVAEGLLGRSELGPLVLYNYTDKCTYERAWTSITMACRGLVFDRHTGECVARPFAKFFNLDEHETTRLAALPIGAGFTAFEKLDGSLGIMFLHE